MVSSLPAMSANGGRPNVTHHGEPIACGFCQWQTKKLETDEEYNQQFAENGAFPISADLDLYVHDLSFHLASFVFPADFLNAVR